MEVRDDLYRDDLPGARARREVLLGECKEQLAALPPHCSHVFAHRVARSAAGLVALGFSAFELRIAHRYVTGVDLLAIGLMLAIAVVGVYLGVMVVAERGFVRRMQKCIVTTDDVYADIERFGAGPTAIADKLLRRSRGTAIGLSVAGAIALIVTFGFALFVVGGKRNGVVPEVFVEHNANLLLLGLVAGLVLAVVFGRSSRHVD